MDYKSKSDEALVDETLNISERSSVEMMRRLKNSIEHLDKNTTRWSRSLLIATLVLLVVAIVQLVTTIFIDIGNPWIAVVVEITALSIIFYWGRKIAKDFLDK